MLETDHIATAFDRDLEGIQTQIMKMGGLVEEAISSASQALHTRDGDLADQVIQGDKVIDALEETINTMVAELIALRGPIASDLRTVLSVLKLASSLERCGDLSKNMAKRTHVLMDLESAGSATKSLQRMAGEVQTMLSQALDAYIRRDIDLAETVRARDVDIDQMYSALFREFLTYMMEDPRNITTCMHLHFIAKNIERMGDHATTIAEQVIYLVTGELPEEARQKGETTDIELP